MTTRSVQLTPSGSARQARALLLRRTRSWLGREWPLVMPPAAMFCLALWSINGASLWRDEAATLSAIRRPLPELCSMLGRTDGVHSLYYLVMWPLVRLLGTSELWVRLPSAIGMSAAALGVAAIGRRLVSSRTGLVAGLFFAFLPVTSRYGQEARSYALVMALAVLASYLLVRVNADPARPRRWLAGYALALAVLGWANLMSLLLIPAHAVTRLWDARHASDSSGRALAEPRRSSGWLIAVTAAGVLVLPVAVLAWHQRHGTARFLGLTSWAAVGSVPDGLVESWPVLAATIPLAVAGRWRAGQARAALGRLALPWLALPPLVLLGAGAFTPVYVSRYILFCVPALALLAGSGLDRLVTRFAERPAAKATSARRCMVIALAGVAAIAALSLPSQLAYRQPDGHLDNFRLLARILAAHERRGDAIIYAPPWWRQISAAYPASFARLRDIALARSPEQQDNFTGTQVTPGQLATRLSTIHRAWVAEIDPFRPYYLLHGDGWRIAARWSVSDFTLILYRRP